ncbi:FecR family protein [Verrucomicrobiales bacterium]|nr:FecR family protein [Verrucomicrobiales bacterium]
MKELSSQEREWIESYLNGTLSPGAFEALQDRMMQSPALRKAMRRYLSLDYHLQDGGSELERVTPSPIIDFSQPPSSKTNKPWYRTIWAAAAIALLAAGLTFSLRVSRAERATISAIHGPVQWTNSEGQTLDQLQPGTSFDGGLLESLLPESWIELAFQDGSKVTMSGHSALMVSAGERKQLHLRHGILSAEVTPQSDGFPMVVNTPTAELKVLGTQFDIDARRNVTKLIVNEGRVQMKRLVDGSSAEVNEGHQVVAAVDGTHKLEVLPRGKAKRVWRSDLAKEVTYGKWSTDGWKLAIKELKKMVASGEISQAEGIAKFEDMVRLAKGKGRLKADSKSSGPGKRAQAVVVLSLSRGSDSPVIVPENAKFRIRGNLETSTTVEFGFTIYRPSGQFAGKYSTERILSNSGEDGFDIEIALDLFQPNHQKNEHAVSGMEIRDWWCATKNHAARLEITHVELLTPSP